MHTSFYLFQCAYQYKYVYIYISTYLSFTDTDKKYLCASRCEYINTFVYTHTHFNLVPLFYRYWIIMFQLFLSGAFEEKNCSQVSQASRWSWYELIGTLVDNLRMFLRHRASKPTISEAAESYGHPGTPPVALMKGIDG